MKFQALALLIAMTTLGLLLILSLHPDLTWLLQLHLTDSEGQDPHTILPMVGHPAIAQSNQTKLLLMCGRSQVAPAWLVNGNDTKHYVTGCPSKHLTRRALTCPPEDVVPHKTDWEKSLDKVIKIIGLRVFHKIPFTILLIMIPGATGHSQTITCPILVGLWRNWS